MRRKIMTLMSCVLVSVVVIHATSSVSLGQLSPKPNRQGYYRCWACQGRGHTNTGHRCSYCGGGGVRNINRDRLTPCGRSSGPYLRSPGSSQCFIATAAYGTAWESNVVTLRCFREKYLLTNSIGRNLVAAYYKHSPPIAEFIQARPWARFAVRQVLTPLVIVTGAMLGDVRDIATVVLWGLVLCILFRTLRLMRRSRQPALLRQC